MKATVIRQWIAGLACAVLLVVALVRTVSDVELTYQPGTNDAGPVVVQCRGLPDRLVVRDDRQYHQVLEGQAVLEERADEDPLTGVRAGASAETRHGIDNDCLRAQDSRNLEVSWWIAGALLGAIAFAMARLRIPAPLTWGELDDLGGRALDRASVDTTPDRNRPRR